MLINKTSKTKKNNWFWKFCFYGTCRCAFRFLPMAGFSGIVTGTDCISRKCANEISPILQLFLVDIFLKIEYNISRENPTFPIFLNGGVEMVANTFIDNAKVMAKGQITIPKDIRDILGISSGDRVTFVVENGNVRLINSAVYAMQMLQAQMDGEAENTGLTTDEAVMDLVKEVRAESEDE